MKKIISWVLAAVGAFFAFLPHSIHTAVGASYVTHQYHVAFGIACLIAGALMFWKK